MLDGGFIQNSKLLIQNFAVCAECAFPEEHRSFQSSVLPRSLPLILPWGLPLAGCPASAHWLVFRGEAGLGQEEIQGSVFRDGVHIGEIVVVLNPVVTQLNGRKSKTSHKGIGFAF